MKTYRSDIRNVAIIAHVDHGKTTLVDGLLQQARVFHEKKQLRERVMDSNELERERGITILAKNTAIDITDPKTGQLVKINIVDTPGHADFGGEVERVLNMVDGVLLLVDAAEGPRPQTRFVLQKALELNHKVIVVINKVDRKLADCTQVLNDTFDLFIELGASEEQANFPVVYTIATQHRAGLSSEVGPDLQPLFQTILQSVPGPEVRAEDPLQMLVTSLEYDNFRGPIAIGRIFAGKISSGEQLVYLTADSAIVPGVVTYLYDYQGLERREIEVASAGEIVAVAGLEGISIGDSISSADSPRALPRIKVEAPTVQMTFGVNTSPFFGREGTWKTSRKIRERLFREIKSNLALRVEDTSSTDSFLVSGRGELHLAILIETMRREGYEFHVSRPEVILKASQSGEILEPFEEIRIEVQPADIGAVMESINHRQGALQEMKELVTGTVMLTFIAPTRGILGFRHHLLTMTRGTGVLTSSFHGYAPQAGPVEIRTRGSLVAWETGTATTFGLKNAEERGILFIEPGAEVYQGMVVGENKRPDDIEVNVCKTKHLTNMRNSIREIDQRLVSPREMSLDQYIEYLADDELLEVTPKNLRIRKRVLDHGQRLREAKQRTERIPS